MIKLPSSLTTVTPFSKLLAGILFITFIVSAFFAGMKYQRAITLIAYQQSNLITAKPSPTPDPTTNWKTYTNNDYAFSIKYPCNLDCQKNPPLLRNNQRISIPTTNDRNSDVLIFTTTGKYLEELPDHCFECDGLYLYSDIVKNLNATLGSTCKIKNLSFTGVDMPCEIISINQQKTLKIYRKFGSPYAGPEIEYFIPRDSNNWLWLVVELHSSKELEKDLQDKASLPDDIKLQIEAADAVLNTLKFTDKNQTACTMEAKLCPDGKTYVSRTGPNCEFSPCP